MSETLAYVGGLLLAVATVPQMVRLLRTRSAGDFGWLFTALNFVGLALFAYRSFEIREWGFFAVNVLTTTFWGLVLAVKVHAAKRPRPPRIPGGGPQARRRSVPPTGAPTTAAKAGPGTGRT